MNILIGADPEVFLEVNGKITPSIGRVPGSKEHPHKTENGWVQPDNVLAEFNIAPATSREEFLRSIKACMSDLSQFGGVRVMSSHVFGFDELLDYGQAAFTFGCDPDYDAWRDGARNRAPSPETVGGLRTAGGHVHIGCQVAIDRPLDVVRGCDVLLGLSSLYFDDDSRRRQVYGKAGAFRWKNYGVEYRTLSNFWLRDDDLILWAYDNTVRVVQELDQLTAFNAEHGSAVRDAINNGDKAQATELLSEYAKYA